MHARVNGTRPDGVPYRALDPELIAWVHTCIPWGVMDAYERFNRPLEHRGEGPLPRRAVRGRADERRRGGADDRRRPRGVHRGDAPEARGTPTCCVEFFDFLVDGPLGALTPAGAAGAPVQALPGRIRDEPGAALGAGDDRVRPLRELCSGSCTSPRCAPTPGALRWSFGTPPWRRARGRADGRPSRRASSNHVDANGSAPADRSVTGRAREAVLGSWRRAAPLRRDRRAASTRYGDLTSRRTRTRSRRAGTTGGAREGSSPSPATATSSASPSHRFDGAMSAGYRSTRSRAPTRARGS